MKRPLFSTLIAPALGLILAGSPVGTALAHVGYTSLGGDYSNVTLNSTAASNAGWIAGQDSTTWANSHDNRFFTFTLANTMQVNFTITGTNTNGNGILNPGYSIFTGAGLAGAHDGAGNLPAGAAVPLSYLSAQTGFASWSPFAGTNDEIDAANGATPLTTQHWGQYRSNADVTMSTDGLPLATPPVPGVVSTIVYTGLSGSNDTGNTVTGSYLLGPGIYSLVVGGANPFDLQTYLSAAIATNGNYSATQDPAILAAYNAARLARTFSIEFAAVPLPAAVYLFGSGLVGIAAFARRRMIA